MQRGISGPKTEATRLAKNARISETIRATQDRRSQLACKTFDLKLTRLTKAQRSALEQTFREAKWLRNHCLATGNTDYKINHAQVKLPNGTLERRKLELIGSQVKQSVLKQLATDKKSLSALKRGGHKIGGLKFEREHSTIELKQHGTTYQLECKRARLQNIGWVRVLGSRQLDGWEVGPADLCNTPDGYHLRVTAWKDVRDEFQAGTVIGLDLGLATHVTTSAGGEYSMPAPDTQRLKRLQRKLARQVRGSKGSYRTRSLIKREYQKLGYGKDDWANKLCHELLRNETVVLQDEQLNNWKRRRGRAHPGRTVQRAALGRVKRKLVPHSRSVVLDKWEPSTQLCGQCGRKNKLELSERSYSCACGYGAPRDVHAARGMVRIAVSKKLIKQPVGCGGSLVERALDGQFWSRLAVKPETLDYGPVAALALPAREASGSLAQM